MLNKGWRIFATGLSFSVFGLGGIVLPWLIIPVLYFWPGTPMQKERRAKTVVHYAFRCFVELMRLLGILSYTVEQRDKLNQPGQLIIANHPTLIDVVFLIAFIKQADCIVKSGLLRNPFMYGPISLAQYITNDNPEAVVELAAESLQRGNSLIIFPEGTRTTPGQALNMHRGAANIALHAGCAISPVLISCQPVTLTKGLPWYQIPDQPFHICLERREKLDISAYRESANRPVAARKLTQFLEQYFTQEIVTNE